MLNIRPVLLTLCILLLAACGRHAMHLVPVTPEIREAPAQDGIAKNSKGQSNELMIWSHFDVSGTTQYFESLYPDVKVKARIIDFNEIIDDFIQACHDGSAPDILVFDGDYISKLNGIDCLEDLSRNPYDTRAYTEKIPDKYVPLYSSLGHRKLLGIPLDITSGLIFYRQDLLAENGFPSEPDELSTYLKDPDHWIYMAAELKKQNIYIFQYESDPMNVASMAYTMFDDQLKFNRSGKDFESALKVSRAVKHSGLSLRSSVWDTVGQEALQSGQLAMVYMGSWGIGNLMDWAPDLSGKWRAAELPLGLSGFHSGSAAGIAKISKNKAMAWNYIKLMSTLTKPYMDKSKQNYLGGQDLLPLIERSVSNPSSLFPSPLDKQVESIWNSRVQWMIETNRPAADVLQETSEYMELITEADRAQLSKFVGSGGS